MKSFYGVYRLPHALVCDGSCFGSQIEIEISGVKGLVCFPEIFYGKERENGGDPFLVCPKKYCTLSDDDIGSSKYNEWGRVTSYLANKSNDPKDYSMYCAKVYKVVLVFENESKESLQVVYDGIDEWFKNFYSLATIELGLSCYHSSSKIEKKSPELCFYESDQNKLRRIHFEHEGLMSMILTVDDKGLSIQQYKKVANEISAGMFLTFEYAMYLEAIHSFDQGDYKSVVVNCSIAIEGAIVKEIKKVCVERNLSSTKFFEKYRTLGGMFSLAERLKITLPTSDYRKNINKIRNGVVHDGDNPSEKQANKFLKDTKLYLEKFCEMVERKTLFLFS